MPVCALARASLTGSVRVIVDLALGGEVYWVRSAGRSVLSHGRATADEAVHCGLGAFGDLLDHRIAAQLRIEARH